MSRLQSYIFRQTLGPLAVALLSLAGLALLTQSLSTLELIVQNRQSADVFALITLLALPQLVGIILPMAVLLGSLYALNRLNTDSELVVARATGVGPWQIASPVLRLSLLAALVHLLITLFVQPKSFREMRAAILDVRADVAATLVLPGQFTTPAPGLTLYAQDMRGDGTIANLVIHDARQDGPATTYVAETGRLTRSNSATRLTLSDGSIQQRVSEAELDLVAFRSHQIDMSGIVADDTMVRLKSSDRFLHELFHPLPVDMPRATAFAAEAHGRLSAPLYNPALALLAVAFLARGRHRRLGYGPMIAACTAFGFAVRLAGFAVGSAAEGQPALNPVQYAIPLSVIAACLVLMVTRAPSPRPSLSA